MEEKNAQKTSPNIPEIFLKPYDPKAYEDNLYEMWESSGYFNPDTCIEKGVTGAEAETFSIVLPPPNVTGTLHMGHASMLAIEDILVRYNRMQGKRTLWVPGTDSAAIATQSKVEDIIYKSEKKTRHDLGREELLTRIAAFAEESKNTIIGQTKKMGSSLDWSRYAYTLDPKRYEAVMTAFKRMYDAGLIYRGSRIVNWDPNLQTTVSDDEIEHVEKEDQFYYLQYGPFVIGTARPETKFGDKYVVMHPDDARYKDYTHGQTIDLEWINGPITTTVIKDESIDMEFGTGVMTITPWHSQIDYDIAKRHDLEMEPIIDERGLLLPIAGEFAGMHIKKARALIIEKLKTKNLVTKIEEKYVHNVATNSRGGGTIEPQVKMQWFIDVEKEFTMGHSEIPGVKEGDTVTLKSLMHVAVEHGGVSIFPDRFLKIYHHWINNLRPWCISRQIWYGHRIPVWYDMNDDQNANGIIHYKKGKLYDLFDTQQSMWSQVTSHEAERNSFFSMWADIGGTRIINFAMAKTLHERFNISWSEIKKDAELKTDHLKNGTVTHESYSVDSSYIQDPDTLDTWFSSGLWTFSTLGWPNETHDLKTYHPTTVLETGYDILFFWVARMVLMSTFHLGQVPFKNVYLHGLVRDSKGRKMSKSLGNIIDPLDMITKYGADATRLSLIIGAAAGNDLPISEDKVRGYKHFANKVWNISRFILTSMENDTISDSPTLSERDQAILSNLKAITDEVSGDIEKFHLYLAAEKTYHYIWHELADVILEESKPVLQGDDVGAKQARQYVLRECLITSLKILHPFMPFVTEAIWQNLPNNVRGNERDMLIVAAWPK